MDSMNKRDLGKERISSENPAGTDISYSDDYGTLVDEIKKLSSPTSDSAIDWSRVNTLCLKILGEESKNLLVACFLTVSLFRLDGLKGCAVGVHILRDLLENFWDTLFPAKKRMKGRLNALNWWNDQLMQLTASLPSETWGSVERQDFMQDLSFIDEYIGENLPDGPILRPLIDNLSHAILEKQTIEQVVPAAQPEQHNPGSPAVDLSPAAEQGTKVASESRLKPAKSPAMSVVAADESVSPRDYFLGGIDFLSIAATKFFTENPKNPTAYRMNRLAAWTQIEVLPPETNGETMLPGPDEQLLSSLNGLYQAGQWSGLLSSAESNVRQYLFWLDLSYWVATSLEQLGAADAALAVTNDTLLYVNRVNGLENLCFQGGVPFAAAQTKKWLAEASKPEITEVSATAGGDAGDLVLCQANALQMVVSDGLAKALSYFQNNCNHPRSQKDTFCYDLALCRIMMQGKKIDLALSFAERMLGRIETYKLEMWDPDLAISAMLAIHSCFAQLKEEKYVEQSRNLIRRITVLAPEKTINII